MGAGGRARAPGLERLTAICDAWLAHLGGGSFPGGCFITAAAAEFDGRPGPVRDAVNSTLTLWLRVLAREARTAVRERRAAPGTDPRQVAFELNSIAMGVNQGLQLRSDPQAVRMAAGPWSGYWRAGGSAVVRPHLAESLLPRDRGS